MAKKEEIKQAIKELFDENKKELKERRTSQLLKLEKFFDSLGNITFMVWLIIGVSISFTFANLSLMLIFIDKGATSLSMFSFLSNFFWFLLISANVFWLYAWLVRFLKNKFGNSNK